MVAKGNLAGAVEPFDPSVEPIYPTENFFAKCTCHLPLLKLMFVALSMRKNYLRAIFGKFQDCTIGCFHQVQ